MDEARRIRDEMMAELAEWVRIHGQEWLRASMFFVFNLLRRVVRDH
jgi:hypothetical protein